MSDTTATPILTNDEKTEMESNVDSTFLTESVIKVNNLSPRFHVLGLKLSKTRYVTVGLGTSSSLSVALVPLDFSKMSKVQAKDLGPEPSLASISRLILRMARSAHIFSSEMEFAGFQLARLSVSVSGIGLAIPAANARLYLRPAPIPDRPEPKRGFASRMIHSPLTLLRNLSIQAQALANNFKAIGFSLQTISSTGAWLQLLVGTTFGIAVCVCPIKQLTPLTQTAEEAPVPLKHLTGFQSALLSLLLRANRTVSFFLGNKAEVGMITLTLDNLGANIPRLVAKVSCVSKAPVNPSGGEVGIAPSLALSSDGETEVAASNEEMEKLMQKQLNENLQPAAGEVLETKEPSKPEDAPPAHEAFLTEIENLNEQPTPETPAPVTTVYHQPPQPTTSTTTTTVSDIPPSSNTQTTTHTTTTTEPPKPVPTSISTSVHTVTTVTTNTKTYSQEDGTTTVTKTTTVTTHPPDETHVSHPGGVARAAQAVGSGIVKGGSYLISGACKTIGAVAHGIKDGVVATAEGVGHGAAVVGNAVIVTPAKAVVDKLDHGLRAVNGKIHQTNAQEGEAKNMVATGETVAKQVRRHGYQLGYPDWLEITVGTVIGASICVAPRPAVTPKSSAEVKELTPTNDQKAHALVAAFLRGARSVEKAASGLRKNNASLNSIDVSLAGLGLGIPSISIGITLDRK